MLDFTKLITQISKIAPELNKRDKDYREQFKKAEAVFKEASEKWKELRDKFLKDKKTITWLTALPTESLLNKYSLPRIPKEYTVCATDGSEVSIERHQALSCYAINVSKICLTYGKEIEPVLESTPQLYYLEDDLVTGEGIKSEPMDYSLISAKRDNEELNSLNNLLTNNKEDISKVGLLDGTLVRWNLENKDLEIKKKFLNDYVGNLKNLHSKKIPIASYISQPGSSEVTNLLRIAICPYAPINCDKCKDIPCDIVRMVIDRNIMNSLLKPGERSAIFESQSKVLESYQDEKIFFFYLNVGSEIARVEFPSWVASDLEALNLIHAVIYDQAEKGQGYPISLIEAHEQAVITGKDRELFFKLIEDELVGMKREVKISAKALSKRIKIV